MTKQTTHSMVLHMSERVDIPKSSSVCCILPGTIDTTANQASMPDEDKTNWLPPQKIAEVLRAWADGENRPENGSFAKLSYLNQCVVPEFL